MYARGFRSSDGTSQPLRLDQVTNSIQTIDYAHHEIHAGSHFMYTDSVELDSGISQDYLITTPDTTKWAHMLFDLDGSAVTQFLLYEGADRNGTTIQSIGNNNRNSATTSTLVIHKGQTGGTTDGTLINQYKSGAASSQSRQATGTRNDVEIILKQNTKYLLRITSGTADNLTNVRFEWYEHTNLV